MNKAYEILRYRPAHKSQVIELQKQLWSSDSRLNSAYFEWKYEQNPYLDEILVYLASFRGKVVGMRGLFGAKWEAGLPRKEFLILCADDLVISREHRNQALFTDIMTAAFIELAANREGYALTLSGSPITVLGSLTMGWKSIGMMRPVVLGSKSPSTFERIRTFVKKVPFLWRFGELSWVSNPTGEEPFARLDANARGVSHEPASVWLERQAKPEAMAELVRSLGNDGRMRHVRDARYFTWRFRNPLHDYRFLYAGDSHLSGYLVLRSSVSDLADRTRVHISDWEAADVHVQAGLLRAAVSWGGFSRLVTWTATGSEETCRILSEAGFVSMDPQLAAHAHPCILIRPLLSDALKGDWALAGRNLLDLSNWSVRMLYSMSG